MNVDWGKIAGTIAVVGLLLIILAFSVAQHAATPETPNVAAKDDGAEGNHISRWIDREAGVVCWIYDGYQSDGISCLPLKDTRLGDSR